MIKQKKYRPDEQTIVMTRLGISPLFSDHSIRAESVAEVLLAQEEDRFRDILRNVGMQIKEAYTVKEFLAILSYSIKVMEISYSPRRIKSEFFFIPD
ncbi:MAG: hypothetical protein J7J31_00005 [Helicobacteraceae bacterium]|nr:hypothetical protein [Helicobacteraceae bacterium]